MTRVKICKSSFFQRDDVDFVRTAIVFGADVNQKNHQIHSPRHLAAVSKGKNK